MKKYFFLILLLLLLLTGGFTLRRLSSPRKVIRGDWKITFLTPKHLVLTGNYQPFFQPDPPGLTRKYQPDIIRTITAPDFVQIRQEHDGGILPLEHEPGYWISGAGLLRMPDQTLTRLPDLHYYLFLTLQKELTPKQKIQLHLKDSASLQAVYQPEIPTPVIKINQIGNGANTRCKYAYAGAWQGTAGPLSMTEYAGKPFHLRNAGNDQIVFTGRITRRPQDSTCANGTPWTGEEVLELDYSNFSTPGKYYLQVDRLGRSENFLIGAEAVSEAFYIHARGLFHKRCGQNKMPPFTPWIMKRCHTTVRRGNFPSESEAYQAAYKDWGFYAENGRQLRINTFRLIQENLPRKTESIRLSGGWHDAADYDRRTEHLRIVRKLALVYLMKPQNFVDGQLNIPESGNGIPDILDEAVWGLKHLLACQEKNGGVGTWIETTGHPVPGDPMPDQDAHVYYISAPSRTSTLNYAVTASLLALALGKADRSQEALLWQDSAVRAWNFASRTKNYFTRTYRYGNQRITYCEPWELPSEYLVPAGYSLFLLTGNKVYIQELINSRQRLLNDFGRHSWRWSCLAWLPLFLSPEQLPELQPFREKYRQKLLSETDLILKNLDYSYPYRPLWHPPKSSAAAAMGWGKYHPLRQGLRLMAAHFLTGNSIYLDCLYLANDYHNGANPLGQSMTSGLGKVYPACFLDLISYADGIGEFVPGITPYGNTFGFQQNILPLVYQYLPLGKPGETITAERLGKLWPVWRRRVNLEILSIPSSEYSVWETICPAAVVTGYLLEKPLLPNQRQLSVRPAGNYRELPGYAPLP